MMKTKKSVSVIISVVFGAAGAAIVYVFFSSRTRSVIELVFGACLLFLAVFNLIFTLKYAKK